MLQASSAAVATKGPGSHNLYTVLIVHAIALEWLREQAWT